MKKLVEHYKKLSYRKKVLSGMIFAALVPTVLCFAGVLLSFEMANEKKLLSEADTALISVNMVVQDTCDDVKTSIRQLANAPATVRMLDENDKSDLFTVYRMLYSSVTTSNRKADFAIYDAEGSLKLYNGERTMLKDNLSVNWGILYELKNRPDEISVRGARFYLGTDKTVLLRIGQAVINESGDVAGFVIAQISDSDFADALNSFESDKMGAAYIIDDFGELVYTSSMIDNADYSKALSELTSDSEKQFYTTESETYRYYYTYNVENSLHILYRQQVEPYIVMSKSLLFILTVATLISLIMSLLVSQSLSRMFYKPIKRMSGGMEKIKQGDFSATVEVDSEDELGHLSEMFNDMSAKLTDNMNELVNREKELANANIKMMQAQLNPHFIYNTLDTMKWIGKDNEVPEVATLSSGLADIMRASISSGQTVSLKKEIDLVESYASIQQIRFNDKFEFLTDIPDELLNCEVPKLMLQPIVENAILHGLKDRDYGQVLVTGQKTDNKLIIIIRDDGTGIDDETAEKLNNHEQLAKGSNIGFHNVDAIIRLRYGEGYGLFVRRAENGGTEVKYTLPFIGYTEESPA